MKKFAKFFAFVAVAVTAFASCERELNAPVDKKAVTIVVKPEVEALLGEAAPIAPASKTYIDANKNVLWGTGEYMKIAVAAGGTTSFATSNADCADSFNGQASAEFEFSVSPESAASYTYMGLYPASATVDNKNADNYKVNLPAVQNATASSYDPAAYIMVAKPYESGSVISEWTATFRRGTALNKITLKNVPSGVSFNKVKITAPGKKLAGGRHFNLTAGEGLEVYGTDATVEVLYASAVSGNNIDVWFTSWDAEIAAGEKLTIIAYTTDNKSYTKEITVPEGKTIKFQEGYLNTLGANMSGITPEAVSTIDGDYVILAKHNTSYYALKGEASGTRIASVDYTGSTDSYAGDASIIWTITPSGSSYTIKNGGNYVGWNGGTGSSANNAGLIAEADYDADKCLMDIDPQGEGIYHINVHSDATRILAKNTSSAYFAFYASTGQYSDILLVPATSLETVATPTFSPAAGEVASGTEVTISTETSGAIIYYTTDGSNPTTSSTQGTSVTITAATTIKAIAVKEGMANSGVATAQYTITGTIDYPTLETSNVTLSTTGGTSASSAMVNDESALKAGTGSVAGAVKITVPAGTTTLHLHAAGWNGETVVLGITGAAASPSSLSLTADSGIKNSSPFTLSGNVADYYFCISLSEISSDTELTFSATSGKRFVIWGVNAEAGASVTWNLESISITTAPTKTTYTEGEIFDATGMVVTGHFVDADDNTNTKDEAVTGYTISPAGALATTDDHVTITYQGKSANQTITVNEAASVTYEFETVAELNALVTSSGDNTKNNDAVEYNGKLTSAVISFRPDANNAIIKDATGSILVYKNSHGFLQGQTFSGDLTVSAKLYYTTVEITAIDASFSGTQTEVLPATMTLSQLEGNFSTYQNAYVKVEGLTVTARDAKNITVSDGTKTYLVYDNTNNSTVSAGDVITVVGTVADHNGTNQIKVWASSDIIVTASAPKAITFSQPAAGGSFTVKVDGNNITSGTTVASGKTVTLTATPAANYTFSSWSVDGASVADDSAASTTFTMGSSPVTVHAYFTSTGGETPQPVSYTIQWGSSYNGSSVSSYTATWNATKDGFTVNMANFNNNSNGWNYVKCGRKNTASVATIITDAVIPEAISDVTITIDALTASKINSITLYVSSSKTSGWVSAGTFSKATGDQSVTIASPAKNKYYKIEFDCASGSSNGLLTLSKVVYSN